MKRITTIQDISCFGKCSLTVALPIVSAMGVECAIIPTAVLSTHTGGFTGFTFHDLTDELPKITEHWQNCALDFDGIYTGYLGSSRQIDLVIDFARKFKKKNTLLCVDPAMADQGVLYRGFEKTFPDEMKRLCAISDVCLPNITEACLLTKTEYQKTQSEAYIQTLLDKMIALGAKSVVLTGVTYEKSTQGAVYYDGTEKISYFRENIETSFHGTGDIFASVFVGALMRDKTPKEALALAVDFVVESIKNTIPEKDKYFYGTKFEESIPLLLNRLQ